MKVIITDVGTRKSFDVVNIFQKVYKQDLILCSSKDYKFQLPIIYNQKVERLRINDYKDFEVDFNQILLKYKVEKLVYLPLSEKTTKNFYKFSHNRSISNLHFLLPEMDDFYKTSDKIRFQQYCEENSFPIPLSNKTEKLFGKKFRPLILKPRVGEGSVGIIHIDKKEQLGVLKEMDLTNYLIQDKIISSNKVSGSFFLCKDGDVINSYTHQRLRTFPTEGGVTILSKSTNNDKIINIGARLLKSMNWNGFAMIEFLYDEIDEEWKIIELNPRLWGSILLSAFIGNDMLNNYVKLCLNEPIKNNINKVDGYIRWIYPFDIIKLIKREISPKEFFKFNNKKTAYINFTYSTLYRSLIYVFYFTFNLTSIKRFIKKIT